MDLRSYTEQLWRYYATEEWSENSAAFLEALDEELVVIGTGKHEFYQSLQDFRESLKKEERERSEIRFSIASIDSQELACSEDIRLIYGTLHLVGIVENTPAVVDMDCRYSVLFRRNPEGQWKILHVHQSLPNQEQHEGEYYPKTLVGQVREAESRARQMEALAKTDQLTGLLNHQSFYDACAQLAGESEVFWCMAIDLDNFKQINDRYGHLEGDRVLRDTARILQEASQGRGLAGRIGGDEFAMFFTGIGQEAEAKAIAQEVLERARRAREPFPGLSIGVAGGRKGQRSRDIFRRADQMLYEVKRSGKNAYRMAPAACSSR